MQTSPRCLIVHEAPGIQSFDDLHDMTLAVTPGAAFVEFLRQKVPLKDVQFVPYTAACEAFLRDRTTHSKATCSASRIVARQKGGDPQVLMLSDLGFNPYTSLLITTENGDRRQPDLVRPDGRGQRARLAGLSARSAADQRAIHELNPEMDMEALDYGAKAMAAR